MYKVKEIPSDQKFINRFKTYLEQIKDGDNCWVQKRSLTSQGYGSITFCKRHYLTHRVAYSLLKGNLEKGKVVDHMCENRKCVNPAHLQLTTIRDNIERTYARNPNLRNVTRLPKYLCAGICPFGHEIKTFDDLNNTPWKGGNNYRCRKCFKKRTSEYTKKRQSTNEYKEYRRKYYQQALKQKKGKSSIIK